MSAKEGQDTFAKIIHDIAGRSFGFFLDIGCGDCEEGNNTIELERDGWTGILFDQNPTNVTNRVSPIVKSNVEEINWGRLLREQRCPWFIDFISLDVDAANANVIQKWDYDYKFNCMTFETDKYNCGDFRKQHLKNFLINNPEYLILFEDVKVQGLEFEDWVVNKKYVPFTKQLGKSLDWQDCLKILKHESNSI